MKKKLLMSVMAAVFVGMTVWAAPGVLPDEFLFTKMKLTYSRESTPSVRCVLCGILSQNLQIAQCVDR